LNRASPCARLLSLMHTRVPRHFWRATVILGLALAMPLCGQVETRLKPQTEQAYQQYLRAVEAQLAERWHAHSARLEIEENAADLSRVRGGEDVIERAGEGTQGPITDGQVHDWLGATWLPGARLDGVLRAIGDADRLKDFHPEFLESRLVSREGNISHSHWRVKRTKVITVVLDLDLTSEFLHFPNGLAVVRTHTTRVSEVQHPGTPQEKVLGQGEGNGFMWHLDAYWSLKQEPNGVLAECRSVSLSRSIPRMLAWIIGPMVESVPRESLRSTLTGTRQMVQADSVRN